MTKKICLTPLFWHMFYAHYRSSSWLTMNDMSPYLCIIHPCMYLCSHVIVHQKLTPPTVYIRHVSIFSFKFFFKFFIVVFFENLPKFSDFVNFVIRFYSKKDLKLIKNRYFLVENWEIEVTRSSVRIFIPKRYIGTIYVYIYLYKYILLQVVVRSIFCVNNMTDCATLHQGEWFKVLLYIISFISIYYL